MKCAPVLNISPSAQCCPNISTSLSISVRLMLRCMSRNSMRNSPEIDITSFRPSGPPKIPPLISLSFNLLA